jgi:hypothetical protein
MCILATNRFFWCKNFALLQNLEIFCHKFHDFFEKNVKKKKRKQKDD